MFTDNDPEEEKALIEMFVHYAEESLETLKNCKSGEDEEWKKAAHKLKGSAANLGAQALSVACFEAEQAYDRDANTKKQILIGVLASYGEVAKMLQKY